MDGTRFDDLSRRLATTANRRQFVRASLAGAFAALAAGFAGRRPARAEETAVATPATGLTHHDIFATRFQAAIRQGPSAGLTLDGRLELLIGPNGAIDDGVLTTRDGIAIPVVGEADGRSIDLLFKLSGTEFLYGSGVADRDLTTALGPFQGVLGGTFSGPESGDLGDWETCGCGPSDVIRCNDCGSGGQTCGCGPSDVIRCTNCGGGGTQPCGCGPSDVIRCDNCQGTTCCCLGGCVLKCADCGKLDPFKKPRVE